MGTHGKGTWIGIGGLAHLPVFFFVLEGHLSTPCTDSAQILRNEQELMQTDSKHGFNFVRGLSGCSAVLRLLLQARPLSKLGPNDLSIFSKFHPVLNSNHRRSLPSYWSCRFI